MYKHLLVVGGSTLVTKVLLNVDKATVVLRCVEQDGVKKVVADVCPANQPIEEAMQNPMSRMEFDSFEELLKSVKEYGAALVFHESMDSLL